MEGHASCVAVFFVARLGVNIMGDKPTQITTFEEFGITTFTKELFEAFKTSRKPFEEEWEESLYNYLGQYQSNKNWRKQTEGKSGKSRVFVKLTALKCNTAQAKLVDVLFPSGGDVPFKLDAESYRDLYDQLRFEPADVEKAIETAKRKIGDHFRFIDLPEVMTGGILDMAIFGTGILKGPIAETRRVPRPRVRMFGGVPINALHENIPPVEMTDAEETLPVIDHIPIWEYYCDANAKTSRESIAEMQFQRILPARFLGLASQPGYIAENVREAARRASEYNENDFTWMMLGDNYTGTQSVKDRKVPTLESEGLYPVKYLREVARRYPGLKIDIPDGLGDEESIEAIVVIAADGILVRAQVNYAGRSFYVAPYKKRPHTIYGTGVASSMRDSQMMVNSATRLMIDNKALAGLSMFGINSSRIDWKRTKGTSVYPGKVWWLRGNFSPKEAFDTVDIRDITGQLIKFIEVFMNFADLESGIPKLSHGEQGKGEFLNKTARGMSMILANANIGLKPVLKNIDDYWIEPVTEAFVNWFRVMGEPALQLPFKVKANGADSLMAKEIKISNIMDTLNLTKSPQDAILTDRPKMFNALARLMETDEFMRDQKTQDNILQILTNMQNQQTDLRSRIQIDKLYKFLARSEQKQVLAELKIEPDPDYDPKLAELQHELLLKAAEQGGSSGES